MPGFRQIADGLGSWTLSPSTITELYIKVFKNVVSYTKKQLISTLNSLISCAFKSTSLSMCLIKLIDTLK